MPLAAAAGLRRGPGPASWPLAALPGRRGQGTQEAAAAVLRGAGCWRSLHVLGASVETRPLRAETRTILAELEKATTSHLLLFVADDAIAVAAASPDHGRELTGRLAHAAAAGRGPAARKVLGQAPPRPATTDQRRQGRGLVPGRDEARGRRLRQEDYSVGRITQKRSWTDVSDWVGASAGVVMERRWLQPRLQNREVVRRGGWGIAGSGTTAASSPPPPSADAAVVACGCFEKR